MSKNLLPEHGELYVYPAFLSSQECGMFYNRLLKDIPWEQKVIRIFGKSIPEPRLTSWHGDPDAAYAYSGIRMEPKVWTEDLLALKHRVSAFCHEQFNSVLLNLYRDGRDSMGWHRDNEKELGPDPVIASLNLGEERRFLLRRYPSGKNKQTLLLKSGTLLVMKGATQEFWQHAVPKETSKKEPRINLTFRKIFPKLR